jgi:hypothetical protein
MNKGTMLWNPEETRRCPTQGEKDTVHGAGEKRHLAGAEQARLGGGLTLQNRKQPTPAGTSSGTWQKRHPWPKKGMRQRRRDQRSRGVKLEMEAPQATVPLQMAV